MGVHVEYMICIYYTAPLDISTRRRTGARPHALPPTSQHCFEAQRRKDLLSAEHNLQRLWLSWVLHVCDGSSGALAKDCSPLAHYVHHPRSGDTQ